MIGRKNWGTINQALDLIADARARGLDVTADMYPYTAGSTTITQLLPSWVFEGGTNRMLERLRDPAIQQRLRQDYQHNEPDWERIFLSAVQQEQFKSLEGLNMLQAAEQLGKTPIDALFFLIIEEKGQISIITFTMDEHDVDLVAQSPFAMIGSDGLPILTGKPHPRLYGTFPRFIERYVRELGVLTLEEAIRRTSALPAQRFQLKDRGIITENKIADLVLFDPTTIHDKATYNEPRVYPDGIAAVIVAGQPLVVEQQLEQTFPGQLISPA
jgi:N-acyl-D-aspartate/D-glutamate deacylase